MILTGPEITAAARDGRLRIDPFTPDQAIPTATTSGSVAAC